MDSPSQNPTNLQRLQQAEIIRQGYEFSPTDQQVIESLTTSEVDALIEIGNKLGKDFLEEHGGGPTAGILF
jgi:hypothetical protein